MAGRGRQTDDPCNDFQRHIDQKDWDAVSTYLSDETIPSKTKYEDITNRHRSNGFERALKNDAPLAIIEQIVHYGGGKDLIMEDSYHWGNTWYESIHLATTYCSADVVQFVLDNGDAKALLLDAKYDGYESWDTPLCQSVNNKGRDSKGGGDIHVTRVLLEAGMKYLKNDNSYMCGEYVVGGLFNCQKDNYYIIPFRRIVETYGWDDVVTHLEPIIRGEPVLQAFNCLGTADEDLPDLFKQTILHLGDWVLTTKDSKGLLPLESIIELDKSFSKWGEVSKWGEGMKELLFKFSDVLRRDALHVALEYGMEWKERGSLYQLVHERECDVSMVDWTSGLFPFMTAAAVGSTSADLSTIYNLLLLNPSLVETESKEDGNSVPSVDHDHDHGQKRVRVS